MITITINTDSPAFSPAPQLEAARILRSLADKVERAATVQDLDKLTIRDRDGNAAGLLTVRKYPPHTATEWRTSRRTYPAIRGTNQLAITPEQFDEALDAYAEHRGASPADAVAYQTFVNR